MCQGTYIDLVIAEALLDLIEQAGVRELAERGQVVAGGRRHQLDLGETRSINSSSSRPLVF